MRPKNAKKSVEKVRRALRSYAKICKFAAPNNCKKRHDMKFRHYIYIGIAAVLVSCSQKQPALEHGDLLFQVFKPSAFSEAVEGVATGYDDISFSHVGILSINEGDTTVIEAVFKGVREVSLAHYLGNSDTTGGKPVVVVGRVKPRYRHLRDRAVERARSYVGRSYDFVFGPHNDSIYCTELVWLSYLDDSQRPIFSTVPMTFRNRRTGEIDSAWIAHFAEYGAEIPEGVEGTNPSQMSKDTVIDMVYKFF